MENNTIVCSACGTANPDGFKFCSNCGNQLKKPEPLVKICPNCSTVYETESAFCDNCGTRLVEKKPEKRNPSNNYVVNGWGERMGVTRF